MLMKKDLKWRSFKSQKILSLYAVIFLSNNIVYCGFGNEKRLSQKRLLS